MTSRTKLLTLPPSLTPLLEQLCANAVFPDRAFSRAPMAISQTRDLEPTLPELLAEYMKVYGLGARDAFELVDIIQTSVAITGQHSLNLPYFLPLAIGHLKGLPTSQLPKPQEDTNWVYIPNWSRTHSDVTEMSFADLATAIQDATALSNDELQKALEQAQSNYALRLVRNNRVFDPEDPPIWTVYGYPRLLGAVSRFTNPQLETRRM